MVFFSLLSPKFRTPHFSFSLSVTETYQLSWKSNFFLHFCLRSWLQFPVDSIFSVFLNDFLKNLSVIAQSQSIYIILFYSSEFSIHSRDWWRKCRIEMLSNKSAQRGFDHHNTRLNSISKKSICYQKSHSYFHKSGHSSPANSSSDSLRHNWQAFE